jgi:ribosome-associated protein
VLLDTKKVCSFADYFVICSGDSQRQIKAIYEDIRHSLKEAGILPQHHEGTIESGWLLIDFGDVIVHIFTSFEREHYQLDRLWEQARIVVMIQ